MFHKAAIAATLFVVASPLSAQGITGGTIGVEVDAQSDLSDIGGTTYFGGIEYGINRDFSIAADLSSYSFDSISNDVTSATVHGIYHLSDSASVGLFLGQDRNDGATADVYGIEGGTEFMGGTVEGFVGMVDGASDATIFGIDGNYDWSDAISFTGSAAFGNYDDGNSSKFSVGASYTIANGPDLYAEIGSATAEAGGVSDSDTFIGIGARINFGAARGTTFDQRSLFEILPQF